MKSEIFPLQWPQIDRTVGTIRLEPGTTKNNDGRTFAYKEIVELRGVIEDRWRRNEELKRAGIICPWIFFRGTAGRLGVSPAPGELPAKMLGVLGVCRTTFGEQQSGIWNAQASHEKWP